MKITVKTENGGLVGAVVVEEADLQLLLPAEAARVQVLLDGMKGACATDALTALRKAVGIVQQARARAAEAAAKQAPHDIAGAGGIASEESVGGLK